MYWNDTHTQTISSIFISTTTTVPSIVISIPKVPGTEMITELYVPRHRLVELSWRWT